MGKQNEEKHSTPETFYITKLLRQKTCTVSPQSFYTTTPFKPKAFYTVLQKSANPLPKKKYDRKGFPL